MPAGQTYCQRHAAIFTGLVQCCTVCNLRPTAVMCDFSLPAAVLLSLHTCAILTAGKHVSMVNKQVSTDDKQVSIVDKQLSTVDQPS